MRQAKKTQKSKKESRTEKFAKLAGASEYIEAVDDLDTSDIVRNIVADHTIPVAGSKGGVKFTCDASINEPEYNGPIPLGFRAIPPSHLMKFQGPMGKALKHFGARNFFLGNATNAWFDQNCFVNKADSMPGEDAVSAGFTFKVRGKSDKKLVTELEDLVFSDSFDINETLKVFDHHKRCFGAAIMVPCFLEDDVDMSVPLIDYSALKGKTFIGWTVIEPYYLSPEFESDSRELNDPTYKYYMVPTHWNVYGSTDKSGAIRKIHRSWIFFRRNIITSKIYQPQYMWLGPSIPQMILERLYSAEVCANESSMLLRSKRSFVMEADVRKMAANPEYAKKFLKSCAANSDNWGMRIVPRNSNAKQMDSYLSECMPLTTAQYGILCAEVDIPSPKFMMAQLTGFANSGNYEIKLYAKKIENLIAGEMVPAVKQTLKIAAACMGKPQDFDVEFGDVDVPTITEEAQILYEHARAQKFIAEADALKKMEKQKSAETHKSVTERNNAS